MKDRKGQLEEMANIILNSDVNCPLDESGDLFVSCSECEYDIKSCTEMQFAKNLYSTGYRKANNVVDDFSNRLKQKMYYEFDELIPSIVSEKIDEVATEIKKDIEKENLHD